MLTQRDYKVDYGTQTKVKAKKTEEASGPLYTFDTNRRVAFCRMT